MDTKPAPSGDPATDAKRLVDNLRASNREYEERTGRPSSVSEAEYQAAESELKGKLEKLAQLAPPELTEIGGPPAPAAEPVAAVDADLEL